MSLTAMISERDMKSLNSMLRYCPHNSLWVFSCIGGKGGNRCTETFSPCKVCMQRQLLFVSPAFGA